MGVPFGSCMKILRLPYVHCVQNKCREDEIILSHIQPTSDIGHHLKLKHPEEHEKYEELKATKVKQNRDKQTIKIGSETKTGDISRSKRVAIALGH